MRTADASDVDRLRNQLLLRIGRRYGTVCELLEIGPVRLLFTQIEDPDRVLAIVAEEVDHYEREHGRRKHGDDLHLPYWAELWSSARAVGQYLVSAAGRRLLVRRSGDARVSVLDLGCGMGLTGAVAAALGARVLFADLEPHALLFARLNSVRWSDRVRARQLNWREDELGERFELILGADILYEKVQWRFLERFWRVHLAPGGAIVLGEPGRPAGEGFIEWIAERGWAWSEDREWVAAKKRMVRVIVLREG